MSGFVLGFISFYLLICAFEYRLAGAWARSRNEPITFGERIMLALIWPLTHWQMGDDQ